MALAVLAATLTAVPSLDLWWQLRTGELIWATGRIPHADPFSWTARGRPWLVQEWLACVLFYLLYHLAGPGSLVVLKCAVLGLTFGLTALRAFGRSRSRWLSALAALLVAYAGRSFWDIRPQVFTYAFTALFLLMLDRHEETGVRGLLVGLPVVEAVWANLHAGCLLGPVLVLCYLVGGCVDRLASGWDASGASRLSDLAFALAACLAASLATPWGVALWLYPFQIISHPHVTDFITEWFSPNFHSEGYRLWEGLLLACVAAVALRPRSLRVADFILILASIHFALMSLRQMPLLLLVGAPVLAGWYAPAFRALACRLRTPAAWASIASLGCIALAWHQATPALHRSPFDYATQRRSFPQAAVRYIQSQGLRGPMWNEYEWGGYLIWRLPEMPVFIDGRAEVYYNSCFDDFRAVHGLRPGWRARMARWPVRFALLERQGVLAQALALDPHWRLAYADSTAVVYVRDRKTLNTAR